MRKPRLAFLSAYFGMYDDVMPKDFRQNQLQAAASLRDILALEFDVLDLGMISSPQSGREAGDELRRHSVDAIVYAPTMVAPPAWIMQAIAGSGRPIVIWNGPQIGRLPAVLTHEQATINTSLIGCLMLANCLHREGRWFVTTTGLLNRPADVERVRKTVRAAAAAGRLAQVAALRIGDPIPGYDDVMASEEALGLLGVREQSLALSDLNGALGGVDDGKAAALLANLGRRANWHVDDHPENLRSARLALALEELMRRHTADCGTVNCHSAFFRDNPEIGITACLGVSLLAEQGIPVSCTGDLPAALSMFLAELLSGRALYCEAYTMELETGLMLVAAGGEGDPRWAGPQGIKVVPNTYYKGCCGGGASLSFLLEPGPATLISMSPSKHGWKLAWATGEISEGRYQEMDGPNGMFRFDRTPIEEAASAWISSGATHHHALARGRLDVELRIVAGALGIDAIPI